MLETLSKGGYLVQRRELMRPNRPNAKVTKLVTRLFDKNGTQLAGVHNYARMRLKRACKLEERRESKNTTIFTLKTKESVPDLA